MNIAINKVKIFVTIPLENVEEVRNVVCKLHRNKIYRVEAQITPCNPHKSGRAPLTHPAFHI